MTPGAEHGTPLDSFGDRTAQSLMHRPVPRECVEPLPAILRKRGGFPDCGGVTAALSKKSVVAVSSGIGRVRAQELADGVPFHGLTRTPSPPGFSAQWRSVREGSGRWPSLRGYGRGEVPSALLRDPVFRRLGTDRALASRPHLAESPTRWWPFPKRLLDFTSETLESRQLLGSLRFSESGLDRLKFLPAEFDVLALLATVGITIRLESNLPGRRLSGEQALACEQPGELTCLVLRKAGAGAQRENHVCHIQHEANTDALPRPFRRGRSAGRSVLAS
jgi:hypothetical protein